MPWAEFEEKQYEIAATVELGRRGDVFGAGQVLEKIVGYDAAAAPSADHPIWRVLRLPRPRGLRLLPSHWQRRTQPAARELPSVAVSLILQYKRPEYLLSRQRKAVGTLGSRVLPDHANLAPAADFSGWSETWAPPPPSATRRLRSGNVDNSKPLNSRTRSWGGLVMSGRPTWEDTAFGHTTNLESTDAPIPQGHAGPSGRSRTYSRCGRDTTSVRPGFVGPYYLVICVLSVEPRWSGIRC